MITPDRILRARRRALLDALGGADDGTGDLGVVVDTALSENPDITAEEIREIVRGAREEHAANIAHDRAVEVV